MEKFKLFDCLTGRISLDKNEACDMVIKICKHIKLEYHVASDALLVTGTMEQLAQIERHVATHFVSSAATPLCRQEITIAPHMAIYIRSFHIGDLAEIEKCFDVSFTWHHSNSAVLIQSRSGNVGDEHFKQACHYFSKLCHSISDLVCVPFDSTLSSHNTLQALSEVTKSVPGVIVIPEVDANKYLMWGKQSDVESAKQWLHKFEKASTEAKNPGPAIASKTAETSSSSKKNKSLPTGTSTYETPGKIKILVYEGDITKEDADIIVNASNEHLSHRGGGVARALVKAGGDIIQDESDNHVKKNGPVSTGDIGVTTAGKLNATWIVHAVGPQWEKHKESSVKILKKICRNVFDVVKTMGLTSVAMPAIGTGVYGVPRELCAQAIFAFVDEFDAKCISEKLGPFEFRLVNIDKETVKVFKKEFDEWKRQKGRRPGLVRRNSMTAITNDRRKPDMPRKSVDDMSTAPKIKAPLLNNVTSGNISSKTQQYTPATMSQAISPPANSVAVRTKTSNSSMTDVNGIKQQSSSNTRKSTETKNDQAKSKRSIGANWPPDPKKPPAPKKPTSVVKSEQSTSSHMGEKDKESTKNENDECPICPLTCPLTVPKILKKCGHAFCTECIDRAFIIKKTCPICQAVYGVTEGDQPAGTMQVDEYQSRDYYWIMYRIPSGTQNSRHPNPGKKFRGTTRVAYLPKTKEGEEVLKLFQQAFDKKLIFTVGRSTTTGAEDCVTWNDIHHKTSTVGGPQCYGYPDPDYLQRVKEELKAKGIVPD